MAKDNSFTLNGDAYLDVPLSGWDSLDSLESKKAKINISEFSIEGNTVNIKSEVEYNGQTKELQTQGILEKSKSNNDNFNINFNLNDEGLSVANAKVVFSAQEQYLPINKNGVGKDVLSLYLFDHDSNSVIFFEQPLNGQIKKALEEIDTSNLNEAKTDLWAYKFFEPREVKDTGFNVLASGGTDVESRQIEYDYGYGTSTHYIKAQLSLTFVDALYDHAVANGTLSIVQQYTTGAYDGSIEYGWSNLKIGDYGNGGPVTVQYTTDDYLASSPDGITRQEYSGPWTGSGSSSVSLGYSFGIVNLGYSFPKDGYKRIYSGDFYNISSGTDIPSATEISLPGTYLDENHHRYNVNVDVQREGSAGRKVLRTHWRVPVTDLHGDFTISDMIFTQNAYYDAK